MASPDDPGAFRALYAAHRDAVWRYAARRLGDLDSADDVTTEVFVVAWRRADEIPDPPLPWLYGVARRVAANHRRGAGRRDALFARASFAASAAPDHAAAVADRDALLAALAALPDDDRELLMLVAWEGLSVAEAGAALSCRPGAARVRLYRARRRLRQALDVPTPEPHLNPRTAS